jgi:hypothetical protein
MSLWDCSRPEDPSWVNAGLTRPGIFQSNFGGSRGGRRPARQNPARESLSSCVYVRGRRERGTVRPEPQPHHQVWCLVAAACGAPVPAFLRKPFMHFAHERPRQMKSCHSVTVSPADIESSSCASINTSLWPAASAAHATSRTRASASDQCGPSQTVSSAMTRWLRIGSLPGQEAKDIRDEERSLDCSADSILARSQPIPHTGGLSSSNARKLVML